MASPRVRLIALLLAALGLYLIGNASVPLMDRDEPRYAQCSRQMLQSGDWVVPRLFDDIRAKKPPLIYWCQASVMRAIGDTAFAARLPSVLAIFGSACLLAMFVWRTRGPEHAVWTTLVFCSSALVIVAAKSSTTDAVLLLWTVIGQACVYAIWRGNRSWSTTLVLAIAIALGLLTKGLIVGVLLATVLMLCLFRWLDRRFGPRLSSDFGRPHELNYSPADDRAPMVKRNPAHATDFAQVAAGCLIVVGIVGPWLYLVHQRSPEFLGAMAREAEGHAFKGMEGHGGPPGMHLLFIWADFLPWSLLLPGAIALGWIHRREPTIRFALASVIGPWLMVELAIKTKLPEYMLPTFPGLALLTANAIVLGLRGKGTDFSSAQFVGAASVWAGIMALIGLAPWLAAVRFSGLPWAVMSMMSIGSAAWVLCVIVLLRRRRTARGISVIGIGMMCLTGVLYGFYLPRAQFLRLSILTADVLRKNGATRPGQSLMIEYKEPSLAFYQGGTIREQLSSLLIRSEYDRWKPWMVITRTVWDRSPKAVQNRLQIVAHFRGLSVADSMRDVDVMVVRVSDPFPEYRERVK